MGAEPSSTSKYKKKIGRYFAVLLGKKTKKSDESPQYASAAGTGAPEGGFDLQNSDSTFNSMVLSKHTPATMASKSPNPQTIIPTDAAYESESHSSTDEAQPKTFLPMHALSDYREGSMALNLHNLIRVQSVKGSFNLPPYFVQALCSYFNADIWSTLEDILSSHGEDTKAKLDDTIELLLQTLLAVMWIKLACAEHKEIWELLVSKAERWVRDTVRNKGVEERLCECARDQWVLPVLQGP
jgi:hypothetical protein